MDNKDNASMVCNYSNQDYNNKHDHNIGSDNRNNNSNNISCNINGIIDNANNDTSIASLKSYAHSADKIDSTIFRAYDIRGIFPSQLNIDIAFRIGMAIARVLKKYNLNSIVVGRDCRLSSFALTQHLIYGLIKSDILVFDIGVVPTPMVYFAINRINSSTSGIMVTGSHNPANYNGFKIVIDRKSLFDDDILQLKKIIIENYQADDDIFMCNEVYNLVRLAKHDAQIVNLHNTVVNDYIDVVSKSINLARPIKVVVDCGNGVASIIAPRLYRKLGVDVFGIYCNLDGNFPNHHPDPSKIDNLNSLIECLKNSDAEFGIAFDGDGDRIGVVTKEGNIIFADRQMMLYVADVLEKNPPKSKIIYDVKSSKLLEKWILDHGGTPIMCRTGHSFIKDCLKKECAILAGEMSGHIFFNDSKWYGFDDAIYAGARLIEILSQVDDPSQLMNLLPNAISTPEINFQVNEGTQHQIMTTIASVAKDIYARDLAIQHDYKYTQTHSINNCVMEKIIELDGIRIEYNHGFGLIRASNTTPCLVMRFEGVNQPTLLLIIQDFQKILDYAHVNCDILSIINDEINDI